MPPAPEASTRIATPEQIEAYNTGYMAPEDMETFRRAVKSGQITIPEEYKQKGVVERLKEIPGAIAEQVTGAERTTPEIEAMGDWFWMPELSETSFAQIMSRLGTLMTGPEETAQVIQSNFPDVEVRQDEKGNFIFKSAMDGKEYAYKPGFRGSDLPRAGAGIAAFMGAKGKMPVRAAKAAGIQTGVEASQAALGGEFDPEQIPLAAVTEAAPELAMKAAKPLAKKAFTGITGVPTGQAATELAETAARAEAAGITPLTSDIVLPQTFIGKGVQAAGERVPFIGTGPRRVTQQAERVEAIRNVMRDFGADEMATATDDVMADLLKKRGKDLSKYTGMKTEVIDRVSDLSQALGKDVDVSKTTASFTDEIARFEKIGTGESKTAANVLKEYSEAIQGKSLAEIEQIRKEFGNKLRSPDLATVRSELEKSASKVYKSMNKDMGDFIKEFGEPRDYTKWKVANQRLSGMMGDLKQTSLKSILQKGEATPEVVEKMLFSQKPSEIRLLYRNLNSEGKKAAKAAILQRAAFKAGGVDKMSTAKVLTQLNKLQKSTGVFFNREDKQVLRGMMEALELTRRAEVSGLHPPTGAQIAPVATGGFLAYMLGGPVKAGAAIGGIGAIARAYESKPVRNALLKIATSKGEKQQAALNQLTKALQATRQLQTFEEGE
jgi:hypothetical protein